MAAQSLMGEFDMTREIFARPRPMVVLLVVVLSVGWGVTWPIMKIALSEFPLWTFRAVSCFVAGLCLLGFAGFSKGAFMPRSSEWGRLTLAALCNVTGWHIFVSYGVQIVPAGHAAMLAYTMPLWVVMLGTGLLGQPLEVQSVAGLVLGLAGISTLILPDLGSLGDAPLGAGMILLAALSWAIGTLIQKHYGTGLSTLASTGWQLVLGAIPIALLAPMVEDVHFPQASGRAWAAAIYITLLSLVLCYFIWFKIVSLMSASRASISTLLVPALGIVSGALFLDEPLGWRELFALALIAGAVILVLAPPIRRIEKIEPSAS
jgi:drug/metabolite transporter (DMT)-like permease